MFTSVSVDLFFRFNLLTKPAPCVVCKPLGQGVDKPLSLRMECELSPSDGVEPSWAERVSLTRMDGGECGSPPKGSEGTTTYGSPHVLKRMAR